MSNLQKGTSDPPNHHTHHLSSSSKRKTESYDRYKTTDVSINTQSAISTPFPSFLTSLPTFGEHPYSPSWTYAGDITMYASRKGTNIRPRSKHAMASSNPQSCFSVFAILRPPSKP